MIGEYLPVILDYVGLSVLETLLLIAVFIMVMMIGKVGKK
jgi:hypothetical protein